MSNLQTQEVVATYEIKLTFKVPANVDAEKLLGEGRLMVKYGQLCLSTKNGDIVYVDPVDMPDYKYPDSLDVEYTDPYKAKYEEGFSDEENEEEEEDDDDEEETDEEKDE